MQFEETCWSVPITIKPEVTGLAIGTNEELVRHYHYDEHWCLHFYRYAAELWLDGEMLPIRPGYAGLVPPGVQQEYRCHGTSLHAVALFRLPVADRYLEGQTPTFLSIRAMQDLGNKFEMYYEMMTEAIQLSTRQPCRAEVKLWEILWKLTDETPQSQHHGAPLHPQVRQAAQLIELRLGAPISVNDLAHEVGISHDRLTKLFRHCFGMTVVGYIRQKRAERAHELLTESTYSTHTIARMVGLSDAHVLNKTVRRVWDVTPSQLRPKKLG